MAKVIFGILVIVGLIASTLMILDGYTYVNQRFNPDRDTVVYAQAVHTIGLFKVVVGVGGILADMLLVITLNFMDAGWKEWQRSRRRNNT